ncbi:hypothetical protein GCM10010331_74660 [Streptomyces xanthochromogenes]|uniref:hypothetical protein n=1 Tax=Streptomyces xanthochromogenes TaxID=67384 RepID=UPI00167428B2|nr:hypothetical protein [Streptomyces xanthochromogenes]GHB75883.1 hypothetical protein GCM10010331_74660 [Streptomyces xanthochromogenes]
MNVAAKLTALAARLTGRAWAHETTEQLVAALDQQIERLTDERVPEHLAGAASLSSPAAYQPGLIDLRADAYDMAVYLDALTTAAVALGDADLADALVEAGESAHELVTRLAVAAHATIPAPAVPVADAA